MPIVNVPINVPEGMELEDPIYYAGGTGVSLFFRPVYVPVEVKGIPLDEAPWAKDGKPLLMWHLYTFGNPFVAVFDKNQNCFLGDLDNKQIQVTGNTRVARLKLV